LIVVNIHFCCDLEPRGVNRILLLSKLRLLPFLAQLISPASTTAPEINVTKKSSH
jgi:hypothetical protein